MTIIQRLRKHALPDPHDEREVMHAPLLREAADAIESLSTQVAELKSALLDCLSDLEWAERAVPKTNFQASIIKAHVALDASKEEK